ncbi:MAG TPA: hypothetical protein VKX35_05200 [Fermentimonas sp.]|nr:hypothetical protein [Fermentimonas sp.]
MAETLIAKLRVKEIHFAPPIAAASDVATAVWVKQPLTLRDDEVSVVEGDPEEEFLYSHENDAPEDMDITGSGLSLVGSFIKATRAELVELLGGALTGEAPNQVYEHSASKVLIEKAIKYVCYDGTEVIVPRAKGYTLLNLNIGKGGVTKYPFRFRALKASADWDCDITF